ncbi:MAG: molecular chaperone DnaJ [Chitinophagales bacterium]|nr:MAG: molecular chaperone DnaJ [Chitinophagales bacterium]
MPNYKKWIGGGVGWLLGGPIGGLLGFAFGSLLDNDTVEVIEKELGSKETLSPEAEFRLCLLLLSALVIKADGKATEREMNYVRDFFVRKFGVDKANSSMRIFNRINKNYITAESVCAQVRQLIDYPSRLQLVHFLFGVAQCDGYVTQPEIRMIGRIALLLGLHSTEFNSIRSMFRSEKIQTSAYDILGVKRTDSMDVIKSAYRKLTLQYHPDKVAHLGEDVQREAREKYQKVLEAYETIKRERAAA